MMKNLFYAFFCLIGLNTTFAQSDFSSIIKESYPDRSKVLYDDVEYIPGIASIQFYNSKEEQSIPAIQLDSDDKLILSFDDLSGQYRNLYYSIEHCTSDWKSSGLPQMQYLKGFPNVILDQYQQSANTYKPYINYTLTIPGFSFQPLISGNYLLKVYEDSDPEKLVLTRRFYVFQNKVSMQVEVVRTSKISERNKRQKLNFTINYANLQVNNPFADIKILVKQNNRNDNSQWVSKPVFVRNNQLIYNGVDVCDFYGGNEFRRFDMRSLRFRGIGIGNISKDDIYQVQLVADELRSTEAYSTFIDNNGKYFVRLNEGNSPLTEADYAWVTFNLTSPLLSTGNYYVFGQLTNWELKENFKLVYDSSLQRYQTIALLKQGLYDYMYVYADESGRIDAVRTEGSHFETENDYYLFVYYRRTGSRYDELIGVRKINTLNRVQGIY